MSTSRRLMAFSLAVLATFTSCKKQNEPQAGADVSEVVPDPISKDNSYPVKAHPSGIDINRNERIIMACRDPRDTLNYYWIRNGRAYEHVVQDGTRSKTVGPTREQVMKGLEFFENNYLWVMRESDNGIPQCVAINENGFDVVVQEKTWSGVKMVCLRRNGTCYWTPESETVLFGIDKKPGTKTQPAPPFSLPPVQGFN